MSIVVRVMAVALVLSACTNTPESTPTSIPEPAEGWYAVRYDADSIWGEACVVTIGEGDYTRGLYVHEPGAYPFVQHFRGEIWVGVRGGGLAPMPIGDVQLNIDGEHEWLIRAEQTPAFFWPGAEVSTPVDHNKPRVEQAMEPATALIPVTATHAEPAQQILARMVSGDSMQVVHFGQNGVAALPTRFTLDESLYVALQQCEVPFKVAEE